MQGYLEKGIRKMARGRHIIITTIKWIRTSRFSITNSLSAQVGEAFREWNACNPRRLLAVQVSHNPLQRPNTNRTTKPTCAPQIVTPSPRKSRLSPSDRLRVGWLNGLGGVPREQKWARLREWNACNPRRLLAVQVERERERVRE